MSNTFVIVGAGMAGGKAARRCARTGSTAASCCWGPSRSGPTSARRSSKDYLRGEAEREQVYLQEEPAGTTSTTSSCAPATHVEALDVGGRAVVLAGGERCLRRGCCSPRARSPAAADPGRRPRRRPRSCARVDGLRRAARRARRRRAARGRRRRAGSAARSRPRRASAAWRSTLVEPQSLPLERVLGRELGAFYRDVHADHGVELTWERRRGDRGRRPRRARAHARRARPGLRRRGLAVGVAPRTALAERRARRSTTGSSSTRALRRERDGVFAAGDVANHATRCSGALRVEHWANALEQGPAAARAMLGGRTSPTSASRTSSPTSTTSAWSTRARAPRRRGRLPRRSRDARVHRLLAARRPRDGGHERQRVGRQRAPPGAGALAPPASTPSACATPTCPWTAGLVLAGATRSTACTSASPHQLDLWRVTEPTARHCSTSRR